MTIVFMFCAVCERDADAFACVRAFLVRCGRIKEGPTPCAASVLAIAASREQATGAVKDMLGVLENSDRELWHTIKVRPTQRPTTVLWRARGASRSSPQDDSGAQKVCREWFLSFFAAFFSADHLLVLWVIDCTPARHSQASKPFFDALRRTAL